MTFPAITRAASISSLPTAPCASCPTSSVMARNGTVSGRWGRARVEILLQHSIIDDSLLLAVSRSHGTERARNSEQLGKVLETAECSPMTRTALLLILLCFAGCTKPQPMLAHGKPVQHWVDALHEADVNKRVKAVEVLGNVGVADAAAIP